MEKAAIRQRMPRVMWRWVGVPSSQPASFRPHQREGPVSPTKSPSARWSAVGTTTEKSMKPSHQ